MSKEAVLEVVVDGQNITARLMPLLISLSVSDKAGLSSDTASIEIDDTNARAIMPREKAPISIKLGWKGEGIGLVFMGTVDEVRSQGGRSGRTLSISAKGVDTRGKAKQGQRQHFDDASIDEAMQGAAKAAGLTASVDPAFASIIRPYIALDDESFIAFGERIARELGATFKVVGSKAILAKRNGGTNPAGAALPTVIAKYGENLHDWDIAPILGRPIEKEARSRWYDPKAAAYQEEKAETGTEDGETTLTATFIEADQGRAQEQAGSDAAESDRKSGEGSVSIEGNIGAQPEGLCIVVGARPGVDGSYRIDGVTHDYSRGSGFVTRLELGQPKGEAGKDKRKSSDASDESGGDFSLPADPDLG